MTATDFSKVVSDFDTKSSVPPEQLAWCGADAVVLYWPELLLMVCQSLLVFLHYPPSSKSVSLLYTGWALWGLD